MDPHPLHTAALIASGGALGALGRYYTALTMKTLLGDTWPWGTLAVNLAGSLALGWLAGALEHRQWVSPQLAALVMTGGLGALTTFSTFSVESVKLFKQGHTALALAYVLVSVLGGLSMAGMGLWLEQR